MSQNTPSEPKVTTPITLNTELRRLVEIRIQKTLEGIQDTINQMNRSYEISPEEIKTNLQVLEESFNILFQKWNLGILYTLFLKNKVGFSELKRILGVNSRTLSDKLKLLTENGYVSRDVYDESPLRVEYSVTHKGKNTVLLALPLLYSTISDEV
ncbi:MAG: helix-turn-helix transcriptional regulator [Candidatus Bathyarchaeota archaeon]|nr:helix-turn-helix transcriptional regulator [Candidatus Bathyarchaeota archaeon]